MTNNKVTQKDIYEAIQDFRSEVTHMFEKQAEGCNSKYEKVQEQVTENTDWRNKAIGQVTVIFAIIGLGVNWLWDILVSNK